MTYPEAIDFLFNALPVWERAGADAYKPGLERISEFVDKLDLFSSERRSGNARPEKLDDDSTQSYSLGQFFGLAAASPPLSRKPSENPIYIHVAGTNGKGSTCHMLAAVLQSAGLRTGLFTSPHLVDFRERIRVDGEMIPEEAVVEFTERWRNEMVRAGLTFFEMTTAMALWWFDRAGRNAYGDSMLRKNVDVAIIETGLGGRLDSTNIVTPIVSVITNIGLEHTQYLGDTIARIAAEKAGIIKPGVPVVIGETDPESERVFRARAAETGSEIVIVDEQPSEEIYALDMEGDYQQKNLATTLATVDILRRTLAIPDDALREGLAHTAALTGLAGRWQVAGREPLVVLDTAHNAHGIALTARQIAHQKFDKLYMVLGFAGDKDLDAIIPLLPRHAHYILTAADTPRAMPAEELARRFTEHGIAAETAPAETIEIASVSTAETAPAETIEIAKTAAAAVERALSLATPRDMIFIGGSNFVVGEALRSNALKTEPKDRINEKIEYSHDG